MTSHLSHHPALEAAASQLVAVGRDFYERGWALATGGNFSMRLGTNAMVITASGREKGELTVDDMVVMDLDGRMLPSNSGSGSGSGPASSSSSSRARPSAETKLHARLYTRIPHAGAVLHVHSPSATVLSRLDAPQGVLEISGYEMLKALSDVRTHQHTERVPIFSNTQNMEDLAHEVDAWMDAFGSDALHGYLVAGHGLYAWGRTMREARRHVEAFEFLFDCTLRTRNATRHAP
ncbi:methylthioribulose 1-phosphate dehydratase [Pendulispora albinea]|uniref:Methylthioribulose-1-phosphate dehydratase n=1 Tax=Pendulispora albinea TaxID=2741071 RepID=A0ABZ2LS25_9BACT